VLLPALLSAAAALCGAAMPLAWHHLDVPGEGYTVLRGWDIASWLVVAAAPALAFAVRFSRWGFGYFGRPLLLAYTFCVCIGLYSDYINAQARAASLFASPYFGPGFFFGVVAAVLLISATVISVRTDD